MASQLHIYTPFTTFSPERINKLFFPRLSWPGNNNGRGAARNAVKVMAEKRDNLDSLQRVGNQQQSQPKKMQQVAAPTGMWDGFPAARTMQQMIDTMNRIMDDPFSYSSGLWPTAISPVQGDGYGRGRTPWAIQEGENEYGLRFDMPGMTKNDVKLWVEDNMLVFKGEKELDKDGNGEAAGSGEDWPSKSYGKYSFRISLPDNIEFEKIKAEVKDGVLYVTIPKASTSRKVIDIDIE
ncbi:unnamed protein product [Linum trigynum]|uniref:SHSP domain-containing protein n=1 Tax=Linum trigynum TaxID=586398 RepID=A0AAV2F0N7_9ROSI